MEGPAAEALARFKTHLEEVAERKIKCDERVHTREGVCINCHLPVSPGSQFCRSCSMVIAHFNGNLEKGELGEIIIEGTEEAHLACTGERILIRPDHVRDKGLHTYILAYRFWQGLTSTKNLNQPYSVRYINTKGIIS